MINPGLNIKKSFKGQVEKCMYTTFGEIKNLLLKTHLKTLKDSLGLSPHVS